MLPRESYEPPKWQNWKCELGWFSLGQSQLLFCKCDPIGENPA